MMNGVKGGRYDEMDLIRGIKSSDMDTSVGVREMLQVLWRKVEKDLEVIFVVKNVDNLYLLGNRS